MRIVFIGAVEFSRSALGRVLALGGDVRGVCTLPVARGNSDLCDLKPLAQARGIPCLYSPDINSSQSIKWIAECEPDVIFCFGWSRLLGADLLSIPRLGVIGFHPTALPANRGRHPIIWSLALGLSRTASTFFFMDDRADGGDILSQDSLEVTPEDDARSLYNKITETALGQIETFLPQLETGNFQRMKQDESRANTWRKRTRTDGEIDWRMPAKSVDNLVRALAEPYPGAHFLMQNQEIKVHKAHVVADATANVEPGKVVRVEDGAAVIKCGMDALQLIDTSPRLHVRVGDYL